MLTTRILLVVVLVLCCLHFSSAERAPDQRPVIDRESGWCDDGAITRTTGECICASHRGYFCRDSLGSVQQQGKGTCEAGYGISFFHWSCKTCSCINKIRVDEMGSDADGWKERKQALKSAARKQQQY